MQTARTLAFSAAVVIVSLTSPVYGDPQDPRFDEVLGGRAGRDAVQAPTQTARAAAPIDIIGNWVSIVTEDYRFRMVTPPKGNFGGVPLNPEGRRIASAWDPAKDEAAGQQCRSYGAAALMRVPGRFRIAWQDDITLKIDADAGTQTRLFHFGAGPRGAQAQKLAAQKSQPSWQGYSVAEWEPAAAAKGGSRTGDLKVVTTRMLPGYLRKNGVPYSGDAVLTEYYDRLTAANGDDWLVVTTVVDDPQYLTMPFVTSTHFKKEASGSGFSPEACSAK